MVQTNFPKLNYIHVYEILILGSFPNFCFTVDVVVIPKNDLELDEKSAFILASTRRSIFRSGIHVPINNWLLHNTSHFGKMS